MYIGGDYLIPDTTANGITPFAGIMGHSMRGKSAIAAAFIQQLRNRF